MEAVLLLIVITSEGGFFFVTTPKTEREGFFPISHAQISMRHVSADNRIHPPKRKRRRTVEFFFRTQPPSGTRAKQHLVAAAAAVGAMGTLPTHAIADSSKHPPTGVPLERYKSHRGERLRCRHRRSEALRAVWCVRVM